MHRLISILLSVAVVFVVAQPVAHGQARGSRVRIVPQLADGLIQDIEESADGSRLITHDHGFAPRLWDAKRQILLCVLGGHPDPVLEVGFSPDGLQVLTLSASQLRVWDAARAKLNFSLSADSATFTAASFQPGTGQVAVGSTDGKVKLVDAAGRVAQEIAAHSNAVTVLAYDLGGLRLASADVNGGVRLWNAAGAAVGGIVGHKKSVRWASFSAHGLLLTTDTDGVAILSDPSGKALQAYRQVIGQRSFENVQMGARFAGPAGEWVVTCDAEGTVQLTAAGKSNPEFKFPPHGAEIRELRVSKDGRYIATYGDNDTLKVFDVAERKELPFEPEAGLPTAADFSPRSATFWLGYSEGEVHRFDLATGKFVRSTYGAMAATGGARLEGETPLLWMRSNDRAGLFGGGRPTQNYFLDPEGAIKPLMLTMNFDDHEFSSNGRYVAIENRASESPFLALDLWSPDPLAEGVATSGSFRVLGRPTVAFPQMIQNSTWSPDSTKLATLHDDGVVAIWDSKSGDEIHQWEWPIDKQQGQISWGKWHPNNKWIVTGGHPGHVLMLWDTETGKSIEQLGSHPDLIAQMEFTADGKQLFVLGWSSMSLYDVETGEQLWTKNDGNSGSWFSAVKLTAGDTRLLAYRGDAASVFDLATGQEMRKVETTADAADITSDGKRIAYPFATEVRVMEVETGNILLRLPHAEAAVSAQFAAGDRRILTADRVGGASIWDAQTSGGARKLCSVVFMKDGSWLAYDDQGRFDATDPSKIDGAWFVLDWEGGLEPVSMEQLKSLFYEPKLLAKALLMDAEGVRDVPTLEDLRLYPDLNVKLSQDRSKLEVSTKARDGGGIGMVTLAINGKRVLEKKSSGFFSIDLNEFSSFLLPESILPSGTGNQATLSVANAKGDLRSPEQTIDIGVPPGLQTPPIKLYALTVGVGDYAGTGGDLFAPPSDAEGIADAIRRLGERLLPSRVSVTVMTTKSQVASERPTRQNVVGWLKETAAKATSSDIVVLFFAGHGVSRVGDRAGYFFLTAEADPTNVGVAALGEATISAEELQQALAGIAANKQVVILDTCHSGAAAKDLLGANRSLSGDYQRAWEALKDATGTWLLAGSAADQLSYESSSVDHGMLTYSLLEAIDRGSSEGLRKGSSGELFLDVERWLGYAATRVESLKSEVGLKGVQRPEFRRSTAGASFDVGVMTESQKGMLKLSPPKPIVIIGPFQQDEEDPLKLEPALAEAFKASKQVKPWFDVVKHPGVYRVAGSYATTSGTVKLRIVLQKFDEAQDRKTLETFEVEGDVGKLAVLAEQVREKVEAKIALLEKPAG